MAVIDDFKARFPEFTESDVDARLPALIEVWTCYWGGDYDDEPCGPEIVLNLLAHLLTSELSSGSSGPSGDLFLCGSVSTSYEAGYAPTSHRLEWRSHQS